MSSGLYYILGQEFFYTEGGGGREEENKEEGMNSIVLDWLSLLIRIVQAVWGLS